MIEREDRAIFAEQLQLRRRGRPRTAVPKIQTTIQLPAAVYDELCRHASSERKSLHRFLCDTLATRVACVR